ncbi:hypothetical protein PSTG_19591, partial [Puccinia striiformis f. sp. tritici PST-78]
MFDANYKTISALLVLCLGIQVSSSIINVRTTSAMDGIPSVESIGEHLNIEQCSGTEGQELATWQCPTC